MGRKPAAASAPRRAEVRRADALSVLAPCTRRASFGVRVWRGGPARASRSHGASTARSGATRIAVMGTRVPTAKHGRSWRDPARRSIYSLADARAFAVLAPSRSVAGAAFSSPVMRMHGSVAHSPMSSTSDSLTREGIVFASSVMRGLSDAAVSGCVKSTCLARDRRDARCDAHGARTAAVTGAYSASVRWVIPPDSSSCTWHLAHSIGVQIHHRRRPELAALSLQLGEGVLGPLADHPREYEKPRHHSCSLQSTCRADRALTQPVAFRYPHVP